MPLRSLLDALTAGSLTLGTFGAPVLLALLGAVAVEAADIEVEAATQERAVFLVPPAVETRASEEPGEGPGSGTDEAATPTAPSGLARKVVKEERTPSVVPAAAPPSEGRARRERKCLEADNPAISAGTGERVRVERSLVSFYATHLNQFGALGHAAVNRGADGKADGFRIGGLRCGNDAHQAGLRNGDVIHVVNGHPVKNIAQALLLVPRLKGDRRIRLEITRRGAPQVLKYELI